MATMLLIEPGAFLTRGLKHTGRYTRTHVQTSTELLSLHARTCMDALCDLRGRGGHTRTVAGAGVCPLLPQPMQPAC